MNDAVALARELIRRPSITPADAGCQAHIAGLLSEAGFHCESLPFGEVDNLWAVHGTAGPLFVFAGHTDVVPVGEETDWQHPPFAAEVADGVLWGRGAADMKGGLAAMICAGLDFVTARPDHPGRIGFLITSDEEGPARDGTKRVIETLTERDEQIDWCVVGEPSSSREVGDTVRHGRRGSLGARITVRGIQGHVAYPTNADNPIHRAVSALAELTGAHWDEGDADFPPTSFQISNFNAGTGADNVIPASAQVICNFRYSPQCTGEQLRSATEAAFERAGARAEFTWRDGGRPFITRSGALLEASRDAVAAVRGHRPEFSTSGGTSDGRYIAPAGAQVVELGTTNATIHAVDERIPVVELEQLQAMYRGILERLLY